MSGTLYIVATPIGNLADLSPRARQVLDDVDCIAAEDTRHSGLLLAHYGISTKQVTLHDHNESKAAPEIDDRFSFGAERRREVRPCLFVESLSEEAQLEPHP